MDNASKEYYMTVSGELKVPRDIHNLHNRFVKAWRAMGLNGENVPVEIRAMIAALCMHRSPQEGDPLHVGKARGTYLASRKDGTILVRFENDEKKYRVISEEQVTYD